MMKKDLQLIKIILLLVGGIFFCEFLTACKNESKVLNSAAGTLEVRSVFPSVTSQGQLIRISGIGFSGDPGQNQVSIGGSIAAVVGADGSNLLVRVPALPPDSCDLTVSVGSIQVKYSTKISITPFVSTFFPKRGSRDSVVTVYGAGFDTLLVNNKVTLNGVPVKLLDGSTTQLTFVVPPFGATGPVGVSINGQTAISTQIFTYVNSNTLATYVGTPTVAGLQDGKALGAKLNVPAGLALAPDGTLYVADVNNNCIRAVDPQGTIRTVAGSATGQPGFSDALGTQALFSSPSGIALSAQGILYVADLGNNRIRAVDRQGNVTTLAGSGTKGFLDGSGINAQLNLPIDVALDPAGQSLYVADQGNHCIRQINLSSLRVSLFAGTPKVLGYLESSQGPSARFSSPTGLAVDLQGNILVADQGNKVLRLVTSTGSTSLLAGQPNISGSSDGPAVLVGAAAVSSATFSSPRSIAIDAFGVVYITDQGGNQLLRRLDRASGLVNTLAGVKGVNAFIDINTLRPAFNNPAGIAINKTGTLYISDSQNQIIRSLTNN